MFNIKQKLTSNNIQVIIKIIVEFDKMTQKNHALLNRVSGTTSKDEQAALIRISSKIKLSATLLPIRSVGVQGKQKYKFYII